MKKGIKTFRLMSYMVGVIASSIALAQNPMRDSLFIEQIGKARGQVEILKKKNNIPGVSIAVSKGRKIIWKETWGYADVDAEKLLTPATKFRVGSISKTMTAFALAKAYEEGMLSWSDTVGNYVGSFTSKAYPVTIQQVASHQGGIRHYKGLEFLSKKQYNSVKEALTIFENDKLEFEPGTKYDYSTYGYVLLSRIIEVVSDKDYLTYMDEEVFAPLGMNNTIPEDAGRDEKEVSKFYSKSGKREAGEVNVSNKWSAGGYLSTPTDLVNMVNLAPKIISLETLYQLITPNTLKSGEETEYGIGWRITKVPGSGRTLVHHGGRSLGARAFLLALPDHQLVIAMCVNNGADYGLQEMYDLSKIFID